MRLSAIATAILLGAAAASARPPSLAGAGFVRLKKLAEDFDERIREAKEAETIAALPREWQLVIAFERGQAQFGDKKLTPAYVAEEIFESWKAVRVLAPAPEDLKLFERLEKAMQARFQAGTQLTRAFYRDRYDATKVMQKALMDDLLHIRAAAINCLVAIYNTDLLYKADLPPDDRRKSAKKWMDYIRQINEKR